MPWIFWKNYALALATVTLVLVVLQLFARRLACSRAFGSANRLVAVVESIALSQHASVHVVKAGSRYFLVGVSTGAISALAEIEVEGPSTTALRASAQDDKTSRLRSG